MLVVVLFKLVLVVVSIDVNYDSLVLVSIVFVLGTHGHCSR